MNLRKKLKHITIFYKFYFLFCISFLCCCSIGYSKGVSNTIDSEVYLVFVGPYSGDPSSIFGHIFLFIKETEKPILFSASYGYTAKVNNENFFNYISKGLTGGFLGSINVEKYHLFLRRYSSVEDREIYTFRFNATSEERNKLVDQLKDFETFTHPYFFTSYNCTTFIRDFLMLSGIIKKDETRKFEDYPYLLIRELTAGGKIFLTDYQPSRSNTVNKSYSKLSSDEKNLVKKSIKSASQNIKPSNTNASSEREKDFYNQLYDYESLKMKSSEFTHNLSRYLSPKSYKTIDTKTLEKKQLSLMNTHKAQRLAFSIQNKSRYDLGYRHTYSGQKEGKTFSDNYDSIELFNIELHKSESLYLSQLNLIEIYSLKNFSSITPEISKKLQLVYEKIGQEEIDKYSINALLGLSRYGKDFKLFALSGLDLSTWETKLKVSSYTIGHISLYPFDRIQVYGEYSYIRSLDNILSYSFGEVGLIYNVLADTKFRLNYAESAMDHLNKYSSSKLSLFIYF